MKPGLLQSTLTATSIYTRGIPNSSQARVFANF